MSEHVEDAARGAEVTPELLERYDKPGPRYTSYPTAVEFHEGVDADTYDERLRAADEEVDKPFSVYVHLPFCEHRCTFCGCNVIISPDKKVAEPYLDLLRRELEMVCERLPRRRKLTQLHLGGGTPTYYSPEQLRSFLSELLSALPAADGAELAVEVDPRVTTDEHVAALGELGFNRISLGVQDFNPRVQEAIARVQSAEETARIVDQARRYGYTGINVDLIYGLPYQEAGAFADTVDAVIDMGIDRSAVYSFAYVPWIAGHMKKIPVESLPSRDDKFASFAAARSAFLARGFEAIGMDHFARPTDELAIARREGRLRRNFQGYCVVPADDVIGLGISAIGEVAGTYFQNSKKLSGYRLAIEAGRLPTERGVATTADDRIRRKVIHDLMCNGRVDVCALETAHGIRFGEYFAEDLELLAEHERAGFVTVDEGQIEATPLGQAFVRNLAMCFDSYLRDKHSSAERPTFSRTV